MPCVGIGDRVTFWAFPDSLAFVFQHLVPNFPLVPIVFTYGGILQVAAKMLGFVATLCSDGSFWYLFHCLHSLGESLWFRR